MIQDITNIYNSRYHRTINMSPINARNPGNWSYVFKRINGPLIINKGSSECKFKLGDKVRRVIRQNICSKGSVQRFSDEIYTIVESKYFECSIYFLDGVDGWFYQNELCLVDKNINNN